MTTFSPNRPSRRRANLRALAPVRWRCRPCLAGLPPITDRAATRRAALLLPASRECRLWHGIWTVPGWCPAGSYPRPRQSGAGRNRRRRQCVDLRSIRWVSGVPGLGRDQVHIYTQLGGSSAQPCVVRGRENDIAVGRQGKPAVFRQFLFQLAGRPAGVAQCNQVLLRAVVIGDGSQDIAGSRQGDVVGNLEAGLPGLSVCR